MNYNNIADNVKRLREARRMTQEQLANELGVTFQAVSKWENGARGRCLAHGPDVFHCVLPQRNGRVREGSRSMEADRGRIDRQRLHL